jgi:hypothetical protein
MTRNESRNLCGSWPSPIVYGIDVNVRLGNDDWLDDGALRKGGPMTLQNLNPHPHMVEDETQRNGIR